MSSNNPKIKRPIWEWDYTDLANFLQPLYTAETKPFYSTLFKIIHILVERGRNDVEIVSPDLLTVSDEERKPDPTTKQKLSFNHGQVVTKLELGGIVNGLVGRKITAWNELRAKHIQKLLAAEANGQLILKQAQKIKTAIQHQFECDQMALIPKQIVEMLCGNETNLADVDQIRGRIRDTVLCSRNKLLDHGKDLDIVTQRQLGEQFLKCQSCKNVDQNNFTTDAKNGDIICRNCGLVIKESLMHEGSQFRKFEGEQDRNHHGDAANPLYSDLHNMSTSLSIPLQQSGAGVDQDSLSSTKMKAMQAILRNAHTYTEMNISQFGSQDRKTRIGYKDKQKKDAFLRMQHVGEALNIHEMIVYYAKELFASFRDEREMVQQYLQVLAACMLEAYESYVQQGKQILKQSTDSSGGNNEIAETARMSWRKSMHSNAADTTNNDSKASEESSSATMIEALKTPLPEWDIAAVRSWLLETSLKVPSSAVFQADTTSDIEAKAADFVFKLVESLQNEIDGKLSNGTSLGTSTNRSKVITPRVNDMSNLRIQWQKEGNGNKSKKGKTAGQVLMLKTVKKLAQLTDDERLAKVFHEEIRALVSISNEKKRRLEKDEVEFKQKMKQLKRRPWAHARVS